MEKFSLRLLSALLALAAGACTYPFQAELDEMEDKARRSHFRRMGTGECSSQVIVAVYCDILGTIERMGDHCCNAARSTVTGQTSDISDDEVIAGI